MTGTQENPSRSLPHDPYGHGHSIAAWTASGLVIAGALLMALMAQITIQYAASDIAPPGRPLRQSGPRLRTPALPR